MTFEAPLVALNYFTTCNRSPLVPDRGRKPLTKAEHNKGIVTCWQDETSQRRDINKNKRKRKTKDSVRRQNRNIAARSEQPGWPGCTNRGAQRKNQHARYNHRICRPVGGVEKEKPSTGFGVSTEGVLIGLREGSDLIVPLLC